MGRDTASLAVAVHLVISAKSIVVATQNMLERRPLAWEKEYDRVMVMGVPWAAPPEQRSAALVVSAASRELNLRSCTAAHKSPLGALSLSRTLLRTVCLARTPSLKTWVCWPWTSLRAELSSSSREDGERDHLLCSRHRYSVWICSSRAATADLCQAWKSHEAQSC